MSKNDRQDILKTFYDHKKTLNETADKMLYRIGKPRLVMNSERVA